MTVDKSCFDDPRSLSLPATYAAQRLNQLQVEIISAARMLAVDEVGNAMARLLSKPLTALLAYLHEIREERVRYVGAMAVHDPMRQLVENALREARRVQNVTQRLGHTL